MAAGFDREQYLTTFIEAKNLNERGEGKFDFILREFVSAGNFAPVIKTTGNTLCYLDGVIVLNESFSADNVIAEIPSNETIDTSGVYYYLIHPNNAVMKLEDNKLTILTALNSGQKIFLTGRMYFSKNR